jgi:hypothetical protein
VEAHTHAHLERKDNQMVMERTGPFIAEVHVLSASEGKAGCWQAGSTLYVHERIQFAALIELWWWPRKVCGGCSGEANPRESLDVNNQGMATKAIEARSTRHGQRS